MFGTILRQRRHGGIAGSRRAPGRSQCSYRYILAVRNSGERCQVQGHDVPARSNPVWDVGRGSGPMIHGQGGDIQRATQMADPLYGLRRVTHSRIYDGAPTAHAWYGARDRLEMVTGQSDGVHPTVF